MRPFQHKQLVAFYRLEIFSGGKIVSFQNKLTWAEAICIQERVPRVSIRFSHHEERLLPALAEVSL